jgi:myo-inositol-1(or 4)-monophosphatase
MPERLRAVAEQLATEAADYARGRRAEIFGAGAHSRPADSVQSKSTPTDPVTIAERLLRDRLDVLRPGEPILGEEGGGPEAATDDGVCWVVDPIDGTVNFVYGIPAYSVSVAAQIDGVSVAGAVADVVSGDVYSAASGHGAHVLRGGERQALRCTNAGDLAMALVGTGFGYAPRRAGILPLVRDVRRIGSAALDLCMVAEGRLDAHYEHGLHVWDWAAAALVATEAGAKVRLPGDGEGGLLVAAAPGIEAQLIEALDRFGGLRPLE